MNRVEACCRSFLNLTLKLDWNLNLIIERIKALLNRSEVYLELILQYNWLDYAEQDLRANILLGLGFN